MSVHPRPGCADRRPPGSARRWCGLQGVADCTALLSEAPPGLPHDALAIGSRLVENPESKGSHAP